MSIFKEFSFFKKKYILIIFLDVVIPTNSAEKSNIVLKAGQRVMVLKSPKGIYMQLETGKIIAIKTSSKLGQNKPNEPVNKEPPNNNPQFKKSKYLICLFTY